MIARRPLSVYRPMVGDLIMGYVPRNLPVPPGWTRSGDTPVVWRTMTGDEDPAVEIIGYVHDALPPAR